MTDLKSLLAEGRVVELASPMWGANKMGVVETIGRQRITTTGGSYYDFDFFSRELIHKTTNSCTITIDKIYQNTPKGLICIWDRKDCVDWSKVKVDTKIQVRDFVDEDWSNRYFAKYENDRVYAFNMGQSSFTTLGDDPASWEYARIYREEREDAINE